MDTNYLVHHGVKGMRWGVRRYQNKDGSLTPLGKKRLIKNAEKEIEKVNYNNSRAYEGSLHDKYSYRKNEYIDKMMPSYNYFRKQAEDLSKEYEKDLKAQGIKYVSDDYDIDYRAYELKQSNKHEASLWLDRIDNKGTGNFQSELSYNDRIKLKKRWVSDRNHIINNYIDSIGEESVRNTNKKMKYSKESRAIVTDILNGEGFDYQNIVFEIAGANKNRPDFRKPPPRDGAFFKDLHKWGK